MRVAHIDEFHHVKTAALDDYDEIKAQVENKTAALVEFAGCYCVLRADVDGLCIVCAEGENLLHIAPLIVAFARRIKAPSIVFHTKHKGLSRLLSAYPFKHESTLDDGHKVYRMILNVE